MVLESHTRTRILHVNVQCLRNKYNLFDAFLVQNYYCFEVVCICEHWLRDEEILDLVLRRYRVAASFCRVLRGHGGVMILVRDDIEFRDLSLSGLSCELDAEVSGVLLPSFDLVVITVYRSPSGDFDSFYGVLCGVLRRAGVLSRRLVLTGDFNVPFGKNTPPVNRLMDFIAGYGLSSLFTTPTRQQNCLDNIFINFDFPTKLETVDMLFSDHLGVVAEMELPKFNEIPVTRVIRPVTSRALFDFYNLVQSASFGFAGDSSLLAASKMRCFVETLQRLAVLGFPTKTIRGGKGRDLKINWFNGDVRRARSSLQLVCEAYRQSPTPHLLLERNDCRQRYRATIGRAKREAYDKYILSHHNTSSAMWEIINHNRNTNKCKTMKQTLDPNELNTFFLQVATNLTKTINGTRDPITEMVAALDKRSDCGCSAEYFSFRLVSEVEVRDALKNLKNSKGVDYYGLNSDMLKAVKNKIIPLLTRIINSCIDEGCFPDVLKLAVVTPVYKKGDPNMPDNYRPISVLPVVSKIFESLLKKQLVEYFEGRNLFCPEQFGFRSGRGTLRALVELVEAVITGFEDKQYCAVSFLDLTKAFDCVSHDILIRKLYFYNFHPSACGLISSYLSNRRQCVRTKDGFSEFGSMAAGVPQGSILGPVMFLIFINDLPVSLSGGMALLYADDTTLVSRRDDLLDVVSVQERLQADASRWFNNNRLVINNSKTASLIYSLRPTENSDDFASYLGVTLDIGLTWGRHCDELSARLSSLVYLIRRLAQSASLSVVRVSYFSLFQSRLVYGLLLWGHSSSAARVFGIQRRVVRVLGGIGYRDDCRSSYIRLGIMTLPSLYIFECLKYISVNASSMLTHAARHGYDTRRGADILQPSFRLQRSRFGANYYATRFFNAIDPAIRNLPRQKFLNLMKKFLLENPFYSLEEFINNPPRTYLLCT